MASNKKLTKVLQGKAIAAVQTNAASTIVHFSDGSVMTVQGKTADGGSAPTPQAKVKSVSEQGPSLMIDLDSGPALHFTMDDPGGSVMVRDATNTVKYAG